MRALFIWEAPPPSPQPDPLTHREAMLLVDVDLGTFDGVAAASPLGVEIRAAVAHRDALRAWTPPPFVSQPDLPVKGHRDGLAWAVVDVPPDVRMWRVPMTAEWDLARCDTPPLTFVAHLACFLRHRFRAIDAAIFVLDGLDVERVATVLERIARAA